MLSTLFEIKSQINLYYNTNNNDRKQQFGIVYGCLTNEESKKINVKQSILLSKMARILGFHTTFHKAIVKKKCIFIFVFVFFDLFLL
jgi:hypothetical protein